MMEKAPQITIENTKNDDPWSDDEEMDMLMMGVDLDSVCGLTKSTSEVEIVVDGTREAAQVKEKGSDPSKGQVTEKSTKKPKIEGHYEVEQMEKMKPSAGATGYDSEYDGDKSGHSIESGTGLIVGITSEKLTMKQIEKVKSSSDGTGCSSGYAMGKNESLDKPGSTEKRKANEMKCDTTQLSVKDRKNLRRKASTTQIQRTWICLLKFMSLDKKTDDCLLNHVNSKWIKDNATILDKGLKVPLLIAYIYDDGRYENKGGMGRSNSITLVDRTGSICAKVDDAVIRDLGDVLCDGTSVALRNFTVRKEKTSVFILLTVDNFEYVVAETMEFRELGVTRRNGNLTELAFKDQETQLHILMRCEKLVVDALASNATLREIINKFKKTVSIAGN